jgi:hypothetical protein
LVVDAPAARPGCGRLCSDAVFQALRDDQLELLAAVA